MICMNFLYWSPLGTAFVNVIFKTQLRVTLHVTLIQNDYTIIKMQLKYIYFKSGLGYCELWFVLYTDDTWELVKQAGFIAYNTKMF